MPKIFLRKIIKTDVEYFARWWRDKELIKLTSGNLDPITDQEVNSYFQGIINDKINHHFIIIVDDKVIGHISLSKRTNDWYEIQIIIGEKEYWGKSYGPNAIQAVIDEAKNLRITKIYLEVRPTNLRAINAYKKCGFESKAIVPYPNNKNLDETIRMELLLE